MSGETLVPCYYLNGFRSRGIDVRAICHARVRNELRADLDADLFKRMHFVEDNWVQRLLFAIGGRFPYRVSDLVFNQLIHIVTQIRMRRAIRRLIREQAITVVFEPAPIAPRALSFLYNLPVPVVIGPMSGGMDLPPAFRDMDSKAVRGVVGAARTVAGLLHYVVRGKVDAAALIVANARTRNALPRWFRGACYTLPESGVDLARWEPREYPQEAQAGPVRFIFCGRFVDWKGIAFLVEAFLPLARQGGVQLDLVGDGELFATIARQVERAGVGDAVRLHGHLSLDEYVRLLRESDVYVTSSLRECGGMAMLEAMAIGLPVIGVDWAGAAQYTSPECAILVPPTSRAELVDGLRVAMERLAGSYSLRRQLGQNARRHLHDAELGWQQKADRVATILRSVVRAAEPVPDRNSEHVGWAQPVQPAEQ